MTEISRKKTGDGRFVPGKSGNPAGKPKGARDKRTELRSLLEPHREALIKVVVDKALGGDSTALRICLDRLIAPIRGNPVSIGNLSGTLSERADKVMEAIASGKISAEEAASLMSVIQMQARIIEADEFDKRLAAVEKTLSEGDLHGNN